MNQPSARTTQSARPTSRPAHADEKMRIRRKEKQKDKQTTNNNMSGLQFYRAAERNYWDYWRFRSAPLDTDHGYRKKPRS
jgi:hypothetical protein